jgi:D-arabinose 1-dehydrogenase-like Zn-dependent alcohol dehydrogenase
LLGKDVTFSLRTEGVKNASYQNLCDHEVIPAMHCSGGWAQYITVTAADLNCIRLPEGVDTLSAAALGCRYMTGYRAVVHQGRVQPGQWVAVHGCGGVGLSAVQIAAAMDAMVVAVDVFNNKLAKARDEGAVRRFLPALIDPVWNGKINLGKVFDLTLPLDQVAEGYRAMDERRAIKALLRP